MFSHSELRHVMESAFLPIGCRCQIDPEGSMTVQLINPQTNEVVVTVSGISASRLVSSRAIAGLVAELKEEYRLVPGGSERLERGR